MTDATPDRTEPPLLEVDDLKTWFFTDEGVVPSVDGVSYTVRRGRTLCVVGESGCGKSVTALSIMGLVPSPPGRVVGGAVRFRGRELTTMAPRELRAVRGRHVAMIFQEPMTSLNPVHTVGAQIIEALQLHLRLDARAARARAIELLERVGIPDAGRRVDEYPHQLSGGMKQRVMIAMALSCDPELLIADEPTTALDVTIQAQILDILRELQRSTGMGVVMITHDLGVVAEMADDVVVMYAGRIVERASVLDLFDAPRHPYTVGLLRSLPGATTRKGERLQTIEGNVPAPLRFPTGCRFRTRCAWARPRCATEVPVERELSPGHGVACHFAEAIAADTHEPHGPDRSPGIVRKVRAADGAWQEVDVDDSDA